MTGIREMVERRASTIASLPYREAAAGDEKAQRDLAAAYLYAGQSGLIMPEASFLTAQEFGRMAAAHGTAESASVLAEILIARAARVPFDDRGARIAALGEAVAWLQRASAGGSDAADERLTKMPIRDDDPDAADILAFAAAIERLL